MIRISVAFVYYEKAIFRESFFEKFQMQIGKSTEENLNLNGK